MPSVADRGHLGNSEESMKQHPAWGVDATSVAVRGVQINVGADGKPRLAAWDVVDFTPEVEDLGSLQRFAIMGRGLFHFLSRHKLNRSRCWVSLRAETAFNRTVVVPPVNDESLDKILEYEAQQQVPHPLEEVYWDRRVIAIREDGEVLATLFAIKRAMVVDRLRKFEKSKFPIDGIQLRPLALHNFCAFERLLEPGTIVIDVDYSGLNVLIHHDDQTWFRVLPVGGVDFITRLRETFDCEHREAVRMASGQAQIPDKALFDACRSEVAQDIADEVVKTIRYYVAAKPEVRPSGVVLFESHGCVPPLSGALKRTLDMPVFRPKGFRQLEVDPDVVTAGIQEHFPALAKAVGLALQGVGKAEIEVRLFPDDLERSLDSSKIGYFVAAACVLLAILLAGWNRRSEAAEVAVGRASLASVFESAQDKAAVEEELKSEAPLDSIRELKAPAKGRTGPMPLVARLYESQATWDKGPAPQIVAVRYAAAELDKVEVVLAFQIGYRDAAGKGIDPEEAMEAFARKLIDGKTVIAVRGGQKWDAGRVTHEPPIKQEDRLLRYRYRHRTYTLTVGGES